MTSCRPFRLLATLSVFLTLRAPLFAQTSSSDPLQRAEVSTQGLKRLSIEELADLRVTSAAKREERQSDVAAAITVLQGDDIRRSGATSLAEALRLVDGVHVAQVYGPGWAISTRGFNISTANKLLVMIDGRTVYSPLFSGVFWDVQDVVIADIDRIEVIRGPGGTLWGANAVNGVVNVITKSASDTQGGLAGIAVGNETRAIATVRYGGAMAGGAAYRAYAKFRSDDQHVFATGDPAHDDTRFGEMGFRLDSANDRPARWTVQGDAYVGREGLFDRADTRVSGVNLLGRWTKRWSAGAQFQAQAYFDRTTRHVDRQYHASRNTFDVDLQQQLTLGDRHRVVMGAGLRSSRGDDLGDGPGFFFDPRVRTSRLASVFAEDDIALVPQRLSLIVGSKFERNDFTGFEWQPNVRARVTPTSRQTIWAAVSRAVRMPTRFDDDLRLRLPSGQLLLSGSDSFKSESVVAYEVGYRMQAGGRVSFDLAAFSNRYDNLRSQELPTTAIAPIVLGNGLNARTSGGEISTTAMLTSRWQMHASYSHLREHFSRDADSHDVSNGVNEANDPKHQFALRTSIDLSRRVQVDANLRHISRLPQPAVPAYTELMLRLSWHVSDRLELGLVGQNLLHNRHEEFAAGTPRELFERSISARAAWRF